MPVALRHLTGGKFDDGSLLAQWKDGLYYRVELIKVSAKKGGSCSVRFEDKTEAKFRHTNLHCQLSIERIQDEDIVCCVCDEGKSDAPNEIIICEICSQGYHQNCHNPPVSSDDVAKGDEDDEWNCSTCSYIIGKTTPKKTTMKSKSKNKNDDFQGKNGLDSKSDRSTIKKKKTKKSKKDIIERNQKTSTDKSKHSSEKVSNAQVDPKISTEKSANENGTNFDKVKNADEKLKNTESKVKTVDEKINNIDDRGTAERKKGNSEEKSEVEPILKDLKSNREVETINKEKRRVKKTENMRKDKLPTTEFFINYVAESY